MKYTILLSFLAMCFHGCIGDDVIDDRIPEVLRITQSKDSLAIGESFQYEANYFNEIGDVEPRSIDWMSDDPGVLEINGEGLAQGVNIGMVMISATANDMQGNILMDEIMVTVTDSGSSSSEDNREGTISTTSSYLLEGSFSLTENGADLILTVGEDFRASTALPGLYVYLSNNNTTTASALEIGKVTQFEGEHSYQIADAGIREYEYVLFWCKPFNVKVGEGTFNN